MTLTLGPVIGTVGDATWDELPFEELNVNRTQERTLMTAAPPPPADLAIAVIVVVDHVPGGPGAGSVLVGSRSLPLVAGANIVGDVLTTATQIKIKAGNSFGAQNSSFTGTVFTMPFPG